MGKPGQQRYYEFGPFRVDAVDRLLLRDQTVIPLTVKTFEVLLAFVENAGSVLSKETLMKMIWPDFFVEEGNLTKGIFLLRKLLGETADRSPYIETLPKRGYRFVATVTSSSDEIGNQAVLGRQNESRLPAQRNSLIGREQELADVKRLILQQTTRLITLSGAGGSGKTRLALQVASDLLNEFPGGVHFVSLSALTNPIAIGAAIARSFGFTHTGGKFSASILSEHLRLSVQAPTLLLLDNYEHLLAEAPLVTELLEACTLLKILVTSRVVLHLYGEHEYVVLPLPVPDPEHLPAADRLLGNPAIALFVERAAAVKPQFALTEENAAVVAQICSRLDGLPLAIELAAARVKVLPPASVLARLQPCLPFLTGGARDLPARQQTLRQTIDWSYQLLNDAQQKLFRRLSVFSGGCTIEGAEAVCNAWRDLNIDVLDGLTCLLDHSLIQRMDQAGREVRYTMLETIREYGSERLISSGDEKRTRRAHAAYCIVLAEEGNKQLTPVEREVWLNLCEAEHHNFRAALAYLLEDQNAEWASRLGVTLFRFWEAREYLAEGSDSLQSILQLPGSAAKSKARARVLWRAAGMLGIQGDYRNANRLHREALEIQYELGDKTDIAAQLNGLGACEMLEGHWDAARSWYEQSLLVCRELGSRAEIAAALSNLAHAANAQGEHPLAASLVEEALSIFLELERWNNVGWSLNHLGDIARSRGDLTQARALYQDGADMFRKHGDEWGLARSFADLAYLACQQRDHQVARSLFEQSLQLFLKVGHKRGLARVLEGFACLAASEAEWERALTLAGSAAALRQRTGATSRPGGQPVLDRALESARQNADAETGHNAWSSGREMGLGQAVEYAILRGSQRPTRS
jgi:predicted ATPase